MLDSLAHHPDPYPIYAELREKGVHQVEDGRWVVARAADVTAVLASADVAVGFVPSSDDPGGALQARMARFSDGEDHDRRRAVAVARLARIAPDRLRDTARRLARERVTREHGSVEVMTRLARHVPVAVLAEELGADPDAAVAATRQLALAIAPPVGVPRDDAAGPAATLVELLEGRRDTPLTEAAVNVAALFFQTVDATAGLVGNSVVAASRFGFRLAAASAGNAVVPASRFGSGLAEDVAGLVAETNRFDPPVQLTSRVATRQLAVGGAAIAAGQRIVILLAAANRDPDRFDRPDEFDTSRQHAALTFGAGSRPCPGAAHALALAAGVIDALTGPGATLSESRIVYERRPNLRIPSRLLMRFA